MSEFQTKKFFASANTTDGFKSYFPQIFSPTIIDKIYILKGGPGTGKSGFMRSISLLSQKNGYSCEEFLCSSDTNSLDGVIISGLNIAILDGTSPHTTDPIYPGAIEEILNFGDFLDKEKLKQSKSEIIFLIQEKKRYYKRAYQFLRAMGEIENEILKIAEESILQNKMQKNLESIAKVVFKKSNSNQETIRNTSTINSKGLNRLSTLKEMSDCIYVVENHYNLGYLYLEKLYQLAKTQNQKIIKSHSCIFPDKVDGLFFPDSSCAVVLGVRDYDAELKNKEYYYINMKRFSQKEVIQNDRQKIRFGTRCSEMLLSGAIDAFQDAEKAHFALERIYINAMNFQKISQIVENFTQKYALRQNLTNEANS